MKWKVNTLLSEVEFEDSRTGATHDNCCRTRDNCLREILDKAYKADYITANFMLAVERQKDLLQGQMNSWHGLLVCVVSRLLLNRT